MWFALISLRKLCYLLIMLFLFSLKSHAGVEPLGNCESTYLTSYSDMAIVVDPKVPQGYAKKIFDAVIPDQTLCGFQITPPDSDAWDDQLLAYQTNIGNLDANMPFVYYSILRAHPYVSSAGDVISLAGYNGILYKLTNDWGLGFKPAGGGVYIKDAKGAGIRYAKTGQYLGLGFLDPDPSDSLSVQIEIVKISATPVNSFDGIIGLTTFILGNEIVTGSKSELTPINHTIGTATIEQSLKWAITVNVNGCTPFDATINLGKISRASLGTLGATGPIISSENPYLDCVDSTKSANITISPQGDTVVYPGSKDTAIPTTVGSANGVGIQIINGLTDQPFEFGVSTRVFNFSPENLGNLANLLKAKARYIIVSKTIKPGKLNSAFQFTITYD